MAKLPVLWVDPVGLELLKRERPCKAMATMAIDALPAGLDWMTEYIPAKRCKTCASWGHASDYERRVECDKYCTRGVEGCPPDGSGFCHNHEEAT